MFGVVSSQKQCRTSQKEMEMEIEGVNDKNIFLSLRKIQKKFYHEREALHQVINKLMNLFFPYRFNGFGF